MACRHDLYGSLCVDVGVALIESASPDSAYEICPNFLL